MSAKYSAPALLTELLARKDYKAVYAELTSASVPGSKLFVNDVYANGLALSRPARIRPTASRARATQATFDGGVEEGEDRRGGLHQVVQRRGRGLHARAAGLDRNHLKIGRRATPEARSRAAAAIPVSQQAKAPGFAGADVPSRRSVYAAEDLRRAADDDARSASLAW